MANQTSAINVDAEHGSTDRVIIIENRINEGSWSVLRAGALNQAFADVPSVICAIGIGRFLHGNEMNDEGLRERIPYMYIPPQRLAGRNLREHVAPSAGLRLIARHPMPSVSLSQLKHEVLVFEKAA